MATDRRALVFLLAGQSNMAGAGFVQELPRPMRQTPTRVRLFEDGGWRKLAWRDRFGPEVGFAHTIADGLPRDSIVLCKVAVGGANLCYDWNPDCKTGPEDAYRGPLYPALVDAARQVCRSLDSKGVRPVMAGLIWMQGERDSVFDFMARAYATNLRRFIRCIRRDTDAPRLPAAIGRIAPRVYNLDRMQFQHAYRAIVQKAQDRIARTDRRVRLVETADLPQSDNLHYTTGGQIELGRRFADAWLSLTPQGHTIGASR